MEDIITTISNIGFPVTCVIGMGYYFVNQSKYDRDENSKREERLFSMLESNAQVISENTRAIENLKAVIERGK